MRIKHSYIILALLISTLLVLSIAGCSGPTTTPASSPPATTPVQNPGPISSVITTQTPSSTPSVAPSPTQAAPVTLNISVAASLTDAIKEINSLYIKDRPQVTITPNFASSGTLQQQIENGAPVDVFLSAAQAQMDNLQKKDLIVNDTRRNFVMNEVVMIVPDDSTLGLTSFNDLATDRVEKVAVGDPKSVPAGTYAHQAFDQLGITAQIQPKEILGSDVRQVLTYVESGNVDAGIVYSTDAMISSRVKVVASAPAEINAKIVYPVAVIKASRIPDAANDYLNFLFSVQAKTAFEKYGFTPISN
ncbi:MAG: molybdate ABC transporter substrate-binding protein [Dehalococcoidales bacterium]|nr:molybdate ABC transporter substrate-binding protein [Dehalococcoidales bacterium]